MPRIEGLNFSRPTFEPTVASKQFGSAEQNDSLASAKPEENKESFCTRMLCCFPNLLGALLRRLICIFTLGYFCNTKAAEPAKVEPTPPTEEELKAAKIKDVEACYAVLSDNGSTPKEKQAAIDTLKNKQPSAIEEAADREVVRLAREYNGWKSDNPGIPGWIQKYGPKHKAEAISEIENAYNSAMLSRYVDHLNNKIEEKIL